MTTIKLCVNCKNFAGMGYCKAPQNGISLVNGDPMHRLATLNRNESYLGGTSPCCGPNGDFFVEVIDDEVPISMFGKILNFFRSKRK